MSRLKKSPLRLPEGRSDANFDFGDGALYWNAPASRCAKARAAITSTSRGVDEIINLQPRGSQAKSYQVKQVRDLIHKYQLEID